jgi:hypothetical protein
VGELQTELGRKELDLNRVRKQFQEAGKRWETEQKALEKKVREVQNENENFRRRIHAKGDEKESTAATGYIPPHGTSYVHVYALCVCVSLLWIHTCPTETLFF